jgi:tRNA-binding EMAP/Myf-like protein
MKFTLSWLKEHLDTDASLIDITDRLTAIGLELEGVENPADALRPFRIARVVEAGPHPNADKLRLLKVDDGSAEPWQVVCGAPNARLGMVGVFGPPGTYVPGPAFTLKPAKIRDVESFGMMCSYRELEMGEDHDGIIELPDDAPVGTSFADYAGLDDPVIDLGNRHAQAADDCRRHTLGPRPRCAHRRHRWLPGVLRLHRQRRHQWRGTRLDAGAAEGGRAKADLGAGRYHQLCDDRSGAAVARL